MCIHAYIHIYTYTHTCMHAHVYIYTCIDTYIHIHTQIGVLTNVAIGQEELHVREFKKHAAEVLLNVLTNVYQDILASTIKAETRYI
jgi:translation elongation factor EF-Ts